MTNKKTENKNIGLKIRPAVPDEASILSDLAFRSKAYWGYSPEFMDACREELTYTEQDIQSDHFHFVVGVLGETSVGFYVLLRTSPDEMELHALFVEPAYIGKGIGRALIEHAKRMATTRGASRLIIQGDPNAERFYRAAGGVLVGQRASESIPGRYLPLFSINLVGLNSA